MLHASAMMMVPESLHVDWILTRARCYGGLPQFQHVLSVKNLHRYQIASHPDKTAENRHGFFTFARNGHG